MAIEKNNFKVSRIDSDFSPGSKKSMSSNGGDEEDLPRRSSAAESESDDDDEFDDADSGAGSDDFDLLELGETGVEFCQIGNQTCSIPFELYDLHGLEDILSIEVWNQCLSEEDRLGLTKYLPDMDQETFSITMFELFTGSNFHFGSPVRKLFDMLKGGLCEPRVALYREGWNFFQKRQHYHLLRKHQNTMVSNLCQIRDAWKNCRGYSIEERLRVLNIVKSQKSLMRETAGGAETESSDRDSDELLRNFGSKDWRIAPPKQNNARGTLKLGGGKYQGSKAMMGYEPRVEETYGVGEGRKHNNHHLLPRGGGGGDEPGFHSYGKRRDVNALLSKPPNMKAPYEFQQFPIVDHMKPVKGRNRFDSFWNSRGQDEAFAVDSPFRSDDWSVRGKKKWKPGRDSPELNFKPFAVPSEYRAKAFEEENVRGPSKVLIRGNHFLNSNNNNNEETESESSADQSYNDEDGNPLLRSKIAYPSGVAEASHSLTKPGSNKKSKLVKKDTKRALDGITYSAKTTHGVENYSLKAKQKGKMKDVSPLNKESPGRVLVDSYLSGPVNLPDNDDNDNDRIFNFVKNGHLSVEPGESLHIPSTKVNPADGKRKKGNNRNNAVTQVLDHDLDGGGDELVQVQAAADVKKQGRFKKRGQKFEALVNDHFERSEAPLIGCSSMSKKRKGKADLTDVNKGDEDNDLISNQLKPIENNNSSSSKKSKKRVEAGNSDVGACEPPFSEVGPVDIEPENKPQKKPFTPITPTVHTGFSFSIIHLLSAVRLAMTTPLPEDSLDSGKALDKKHEVGENGAALPSLTVLEMVNRVRSNPGDPCILETQEPLQDLVRGVLKIFSSKTAPLGAKGWKALAVYERSTKGWSWLGPISQNHDSVVEVTSPEAWYLPHKTMVKLVDSFANWLKSGQETLQQIGSLPSPPLSLMQPVPDEKERFRDLRAQKSLNTINQSSDEVRAYFRKEEVLRYLIPDRAFSYTAADGKKSIVAPLRRCGGKPTSKARDHFMLKRDRPPHVTILCLVRDAAARLPGSIGTRADVCTLIRDSQYIVEEVSDAQVNQVVSGALDRLHYERDPCVQFDGERKLWVYLHREREEEDFEDDGTSSTKKWKRQKKDPLEQEDQPMVTVAFHGNSDQPGFNLSSDLNAEPSGADDKGGEIGFDEAGQIGNDDITDPIHGVDQSQDPPPMGWEGVDPNPIRDNKLMCLENSTNEDFDDEAFARERPVGHLSASLL